MKQGLIIGKFMPLHNGHIALINFALTHCDHLTVVLCYSDRETIPGSIRMQWLNQSFTGNNRITNSSFFYDENELANTSVSSRETAFAWAKALSADLPAINTVFSSEPYGDYMAEYFGCSHMMFDQLRSAFPVSGSQLRENTFKYWDFLADAAKPYFVKKIAIAGTESTGKTTLTEKIAKFFDANFVHETAREIIEETEACTFENLHEIAALQASTILQGTKLANKLLFVDTDLNITKSYSRFLFQKDLVVEEWVEEANKFDLYLYLEKDCPFVQDGTRLNETERNRLDQSHKEQFNLARIDFVSINGSWEQRFEKAKAIVQQYFKINSA